MKREFVEENFKVPADSMMEAAPLMTNLWGFNSDMEAWEHGPESQDVKVLGTTTN